MSTNIESRQRHWVAGSAVRALTCASAILWSPVIRAQDNAAGPGEVVRQLEGGNTASEVQGDRRQHPHAFYVELLGKGGLYTLGYDYAFTDRLAAGAGGSYFVVEGEQVLTVAPYLNIYPFAGRWGSFVVQLGLEFVHEAVPSAVRGWSGTSSSGVAEQVSLGYEYRHGFLFRFLLTGVIGRGGVRPWVGIGVGGAI
jgi:hypothetical protein